MTTITDLVVTGVTSGTKNSLRGTTIRFTSAITATTSQIYDYWDGTTTPTGRGGHTCIVYNNTLILFGGFDGTSALNDLWQYDLSTKVWSTLPNVGPPGIRYGHGSVLINTDEMVIFGGYNGTTFLNDLFKYKISTNTWSTMTNTSPPSARREFAIGLIGSFIYVYGGRTSGGVTNQIRRYNISTGAWANPGGGGAPTARSRMAYAVHGTRFYIFGGANNGETAQSSSRYYDTSTSSWTNLTVPGGFTARFWMTANTLNNKIYIYGGTGSVAGASIDELWEHNPTGNVWTQITTGTRPSLPRKMCTLCVNGTTGIIFGGFSGSGTTVVRSQRDVWTADYSSPTITHVQIKSGPWIILGISFSISSVTFSTSVVSTTAVLDVATAVGTPNNTSIFFESIRLLTTP